ncbi:MAG: M20/M25/M40 family metallo-hydrolase [Ruminococcaceae bacterium]|nr:M20/M25/M40 family metallo-hydrolase [Oscillospiraceae bacterium]
MELSKDILQYLEDSIEETHTLLETICRIPAPSHHEEKRAEFCKKWLEEQGAEGVYIDSALNVIYPVNCENRDDIVVFMAHTDVVFPDTEPLPFAKDDEYFYSPGVGDDTVCLTMMLMVIKYIIKNDIKPNRGILFVANACEEGLGNLKGIRQIMQDFTGRIKEVYTFDGGYKHIVDVCVGSHRYQVKVTTEGGHSYNAFGNKNAIHYLSQLVCGLYNQKLPDTPNNKTTFNVGGISGGTSVNTIAQEATMLYEYRSDLAANLEFMKASFEKEVEKIRAMGVEVTVEVLGIRPCSGEVDWDVHEKMAQKAIAIQQKHSGYECSRDSGSTDANMPMSLGVPSICVGTYEGSGAHTREEKVLIKSIPIGLKITAELILDYFN